MSVGKGFEIIEPCEADFQRFSENPDGSRWLSCGAKFPSCDSNNPDIFAKGETLGLVSSWPFASRKVGTKNVVNVYGRPSKGFLHA
jgi:hypothetical protein